jgi:hypothetical protein
VNTSQPPLTARRPGNPFTSTSTAKALRGDCSPTASQSLVTNTSERRLVVSVSTTSSTWYRRV